MAWEVIQGNTSVQDILIKDKDGATVTTLGNATAIVFNVKDTEAESETADISKTVGSGIEVDTPSEGYLRITILPADTTGLSLKDYYMALQITWSATIVYEIILKTENNQQKTFRIKPGIIT